MNPGLLWSAVVKRIGAEVPEFGAAGMLILFGEQAPPELQEVAVIHRSHNWFGACAVGDVVLLRGHRFRITGVGAVANRNLEQLGHVSIKFNGNSEPELPGDLCVEVGPVPELAVGDELAIVRNSEGP